MPRTGQRLGDEQPLQPRLLHRLLVLGLQLPIQSHMLVDRQCLPASMAGDELKLGIGKAGVPGQICDRLVPERVGSCLHPGLQGIGRHDLLNAAGAVPGAAPGLEQIAVRRMGRYVDP